MKLTARDRAAGIRRIAQILKTGTASPFEFEGGCRYGLRASLCLMGWAWSRADSEAADMVATALQMNRAVRPTWQQGQPEWVDEIIERTRCAWCGTKLVEPARNLNGVPRKYCSDLCGQAAYKHRARRSGEAVSKAEYLARCAMQTEQTRQERARPCAHCGKSFSPARQGYRFCSRQCADAGSPRPNRLQHVPCPGCGEPMSPAKGRRYCSQACYHKHGRPVQKPERTCPICKTVFRAHVPASPKVYCSRTCSGLARRAGIKGAKPVPA